MQLASAILFALLPCLSMAFMFPSLASPAPFSTQLTGVKIDVGDGESPESYLRRFKREVSKSGHLMELRHRRYFESTQEERKRRVTQARVRKRLERVQRKWERKNVYG